jgi:hypothetical protein
MELCCLNSDLHNLHKNIHNEWSKYLDIAKKFIIDNKLYDVVVVKDIISTHNLLIIQKKNIDGAKTSVNNSKYIENLSKLDNYFNFPNII